jgi:hypothetical protein
MTKDIVRKPTDVEVRMGFIYIPAAGLELFPEENSSISVQLEGEDKQKNLRYNADHKRVSGLTSWFKKQKIKPEDGLRIHKPERKSVYVISLKRHLEEEPEKEAMELIELSGLSTKAKGDIVEDRIRELIVLHGQGLLNVYRPVVDIEGIDLIVVKSGIYQPIFIQVKGRFNLQKGGAFLIDIGKKTFSPHHSYYVVGAFFDPKRLEIHDHILLVPSVKAKKATMVRCKSSERYRISTALRPDSKSKWAKFVVEKTKLAELLLEKFEEIEKYLK